MIVWDSTKAKALARRFLRRFRHPAKPSRSQDDSVATKYRRIGAAAGSRYADSRGFNRADHRHPLACAGVSPTTTIPRRVAVEPGGRWLAYVKGARLLVAPESKTRLLRTAHQRRDLGCSLPQTEPGWPMG
jgi:hypothetical protein